MLLWTPQEAREAAREAARARGEEPPEEEPELPEEDPGLFGKVAPTAEDPNLWLVRAGEDGLQFDRTVCISREGSSGSFFGRRGNTRLNAIP